MGEMPTDLGRGNCRTVAGEYGRRRDQLFNGGEDFLLERRAASKTQSAPGIAESSESYAAIRVKSRGSSPSNSTIARKRCGSELRTSGKGSNTLTL